MYIIAKKHIMISNCSFNIYWDFNINSMCLATDTPKVSGINSEKEQKHLVGTIAP